MSAHVEIHTKDGLRAHIKAGKPLHNVVVQGVDIANMAADLCAADIDGLVLSTA